VTLSATKNGEPQNAVQLMAAGELTVETSDAAIISNVGLVLTAEGAGEGKVIVKYHDSVASVTINVLAKATNKDKYGTQHEGTLEDPFDNADAVKVGLWTVENGNTTEELYVKGIVERFYHTPGSRDDGAVSFFLQKSGEEELQFEVYKAYKEDGSPLTDDDVWVGGEIVAHGIFTTYNGQPETTTAVLDSCSGNKPEARKTIDETFANVMSVGKALTDGSSTYDYYRFEAYVASESSGNYFLSAEKGVVASDVKDMIELYRPTDEQKALLLKNAKVKVTMLVKNYHDQVENDGKFEVEVLEAGEPWQINYNEVNVAGALTAIAALADGATSEEYYAVSGFVVAVTSEYNAQYGNMSFTLGDAADQTEGLLTCFRVKVDETTAAKVVAGAEVVVKGNLQKYVKNEAVTPELVNGSVEVKESNIKVTVAGALGVINALEAGATTDEKYEIQGFVAAVTGAFSSQYNNMSFTLGDAADQTEGLLTCFRVSVDEATAAKVVAGAEVKVVGQLQKYVKNETTTPELVKGSVEVIGETPTPTPTPTPTETPVTENLAAPVAMDFTSLTQKGTELKDAKVLETMKAAAGENAAHVTAATASKVYDGNGQGGAYASTAGLLKFGTSSANGELVLTLDGKANKVEISCHDFYALSEEHPTNSNTLSVNGSEAQLAPYNAEATAGTLTFELAEANNVITITAVKRVFVWSITVSYVA